jgi:hypothetical protein
MKIVASGVLRRLERPESTFSAPEDDWIDVIMWSAREGGIFGHVHYRFSKSRSENQRVPCSDEEEVEIMRGHYETDEHRFFHRGEELSFPDYLERFSYLGSEKLAEERGKVISRLRGADGGV